MEPELIGVIIILRGIAGLASLFPALGKYIFLSAEQGFE
jgi:hypothetical protein